MTDDPGPIPTVLVEDDGIVREGFVVFLEKAGLKIVAATGSGMEAIALVERHKPRIVLMDIRLPDIDGIHAAELIHKRHPGIGIIMLTGYLSEDFVIRAFRAGAVGYVSKTEIFENGLRTAIECVLRGQKFVTPDVQSESLWKALRNGVDAKLPVERLTPRQREILQHVADGMTSRQIARELQIDVRTVEKHRLDLARRVGAKNVAEMVRFAIRNGLIGRRS